ncbi:protoheme IX farnesyltransferase [Aureimonas phyllosphaerae]|uniref:Protoheme IX farnesyltransferase n=1 Tax=Aureimonas phyllosphaerae TaxID=1166078 RepID=A0A7W6FTC2_9HYPH|nr:protoheme IX farnesyltransferase [Aureimonas phyllosphaerae]MBB3959032.1 protoheme IX farnesyltransferase [Aureimonas phyllosphaerae]SFF08841.1 protoheme IX farnesyltransferase [Aureimonas phyllosphaerae]
MSAIDFPAVSEARPGISLAEPGDYFALLKPRVMSLVVLTAATGLLAAPGSMNPVLAFVSLLAIALGAGASGALNMWYDRDIDRIMTRTAKRPIPSGRVAPENALSFGLALSVFSVLLLGLVANWFAAGFLAFTIAFYAVFYTMWLKRSTAQNIVIGGAAGSFPPMVAWAAVTGGVSWEGFVLFLIIFLWTPPHFWALALFKMKDYGAAGIPMLPNVAGERSTRRHVFAYSLILAPIGVLPTLMGFASPAYGVLAAALGLNFLRLAYGVLRMPDGDATMAPAKKLFAFSIVYLFALFAWLLVEGLLVHGWAAHVA